MTYRTKLMTLLLGLVVLINGLLAVATYRRSASLLEKEFHRKARSIVSTAAALLDPRLVGLYAMRETRRSPSTQPSGHNCEKSETSIGAKMFGSQISSL
jgi:hypothetical protein